MLIRGKSLKEIEKSIFQAHPNLWKLYSALDSSISIYGAPHQTVMELKKEKCPPAPDRLITQGGDSHIHK